jgi:phospholipid transport system substrate-binding protein
MVDSQPRALHATRPPRPRWHRTLVAVVLAATSYTAARPTAALDSPSTVVQHTSDRVIAVLSDKSLSTPEQRRKVETIVYEYFDFVTLSKLVLARNWKQLTPEQQAAFIEEFKQHLSITYGRNLERYNNEKVAVTGEREETGGDYTVKSKVLRPGAEDVLVDYRLRQQDGAWKVIDVVIEGVSLVANFRSQFQEVMAGGGPDKLIRLLHEKNEKGEPLKS